MLLFLTFSFSDKIGLRKSRGKNRGKYHLRKSIVFSRILEHGSERQDINVGKSSNLRWRSLSSSCLFVDNYYLIKLSLYCLNVYSVRNAWKLVPETMEAQKSIWCQSARRVECILWMPAIVCRQNETFDDEKVLFVVVSLVWSLSRETTWHCQEEEEQEILESHVSQRRRVSNETCITWGRSWSSTELEGDVQVLQNLRENWA